MRTEGGASGHIQDGLYHYRSPKLHKDYILLVTRAINLFSSHTSSSLTLFLEP